MQAVTDFFIWLFNDRMGVVTLIVGGILLFLVIAFVLERRTRKQYHNHAKSADDWDFFDDDESGWSEFDDDNK